MRNVAVLLVALAALSGCARLEPTPATSTTQADLADWTANGNTTTTCPPGVHCSGPFAFLVPVGHPEGTWGFRLRGPHLLDGAHADLTLAWNGLSSADADNGARSIAATPAAVTRFDELFLVQPAPQGGSVKVSLVERDLPASSGCADGGDGCHRHAWCLLVMPDAEHWYASSWLDEQPEWPCPRVGTPDQAYILARL